MKTFDYSLVKDPQYFKDGRMDAHSDHTYYRDGEEAQEKETSFRYDLNGIWKFHYARNYGNTIPGFEKEEYCCKDWDDIRVPAHIQMEGYDAPQYANVQYPWEGHEDIHPGEIPEHFNPVASYVKYFEVPEEMQGKRLFISFQGAESGIALWLNGHFVGYSEDSFTPSEFELTEYVKEGENKLAAQVFKWTASSWCEDQDFFRFSGIYRDVYLYTVPEVHVYDLQIRAIPDETLSAAALEIRTNTWGKGEVKITLSKDGETVIEDKKALDGEEIYAWKVENPMLWSAEDPQLYDLKMEVYNESGELQEVIPQKVGFRRFEMKDGIMTLNGKRIVFKGVNRHEFSSVSGRHVSEEELRKDLKIMKQNNINAIRTCHYPDASLIYELCDEYGIYMIDETNLESHGSWDIAEFTKDYTYVVPHDKPEWLDMMLDRANSMYQRDKNHAAILIWSCGNESFGGKDIFEMSQFFHKADPTRLVHYEGVCHDRRYNDTSDMESQMYPSVEAIKEFLAKDDSKPFVCCEYTHAMGNSCGAMHKYTDLTDTEPKYQGGFIWDYIDQSIYKKDRYGKEFQAYGGDFGERPTDYNFSGNGIAYGGNRDASPKMQEVKFNYQNISAEVSADSVKVINKNLFVNTDIFDCKVTVAKDGKVIRKASLATAVAPLSEETYALPLTKEEKAGEYAVTVSFHLKEDKVWAKAGHEVAFGQYVYKVEVPKKACPEGVEVIRSTHNIGVRGAHFEVLFSVLNGGLTSYKYAGKEMIEAIPKPNFWRAPTDNDCGNLMGMRYGQWKLASMYLSHKDFRKGPYGPGNMPKVETTEKTVKVSYTYLMPTTPLSECKLSYEVFGDGRVKTTLTYDPVKELGDMPEFGVIFKFNADYDRVEWYGLGETETYSDRKKGAKLGIYANKVVDNMARYMVPQECGAKEEVRWAKVTDRKGRGMLFEMDENNGPMMFSALPYTPHEMENAMHPYELPEVHYTVVRVAKDQMGVGGDDSWGARTHEEYLLKTDKKMEFSFVFKGL
ncbi:glycoside hydrolase family 2 TIM barrel-domain containing protein [Blautia intestinalis]|uniref:glycoside hydrolase family 2 TIM barrel-domain containing protein n=1 Tax=Blautia intestinalis TaxID=2763028 RepID=UPI0022E0A2C3|nr:glycoside hydrolase family 2 TIM barrel-domain containing protein [Blautia intestinalis]